MKPKRPSETDLLALVQNGFNAQLPMDRAAQNPAPGPATVVPMVRITLAIQEDLRYRLKLTMMNHKRRNRSSLTQDEYCARAISAQLDLDEGVAAPRNQVAQLAAFLSDCLREGALAESWVPKAQALLTGVNGAEALHPHLHP